MVRFLLLIICVAIGVWTYQSFAPESLTKDNIEATIKKEKTINAVQQAREKRYKEAEEAMNN